MVNSNIEWRPISGFDGYEISNTGLIRHIKIMAIHEKGEFLRSSLRDKDGKRHEVTIHHLVANAFVPKPDEKVYQVRYKDGNKKNNAPENLYWVTEDVRKVKRLTYVKGKSKPVFNIPNYTDHNVNINK